MNSRMRRQEGGKVVILGGGLTGISAAIHLTTPWVLLEKDDRLGGHARTDEREGYHFDKTGTGCTCAIPTPRSSSPTCAATR